MGADEGPADNRPRTSEGALMPTHTPLRREVRTVAGAAHVAQAKVGVPDVLCNIAYVRRMHVGQAETAIACFRTRTTLAALPLAEALRICGHRALVEVCAEVLR
jgi:hypothetical protein